MSKDQEYDIWWRKLSFSDRRKIARNYDHKQYSLSAFKNKPFLIKKAWEQQKNKTQEEN